MATRPSRPRHPLATWQTVAGAPVEPIPRRKVGPRTTKRGATLPGRGTGADAALPYGAGGPTAASLPTADQPWGFAGDLGVGGTATGDTGLSPSPGSVGVLQPHPRYLEWRDTWVMLGHVYEGDGPFLDGSALIPHPRETKYGTTDGLIDVGKETTKTPRFRRREQIARYDNLAQPIVDTIADYLFNQPPVRTGEGPAFEAYRAWLAGAVDGGDTNFNDWMREAVTMALVYGHLAVSLEKLDSTTGMRPASAAHDTALVLRNYSPLDMMDWVWNPGGGSSGGLRAVKLIEGVPRQTVASPFLIPQHMASPLGTIGSAGVSDARAIEIRVWDGVALTRYNLSGEPIERVEHGLGRPPVLMLYHRRRKRIPVIGLSLLGDPRVFRDHFNQVSEMRQIMRDQTFSMLAIQMGDTEDIGAARERLGERASTDSIIWHKGRAEFIAPPNGPLAAYASSIDVLERKIYRRVGLSWEGGDPSNPQSADSRRIQAMDLNRILAGQAKECERFEAALWQLWVEETYGVEAGVAIREKAKFTCTYPDEFYVSSALERIAEIAQAESVSFGPTVSKKLRRDAVPTLLPNLDVTTQRVIEHEIDEVVDAQLAQAAAATASPADDATATALGGRPDAAVSTGTPIPGSPAALAGSKPLSAGAASAGAGKGTGAAPAAGGTVPLARPAPIPWSEERYFINRGG